MCTALLSNRNRRSKETTTGKDPSAGPRARMELFALRYLGGFGERGLTSFYHLGRLCDLRFRLVAFDDAI
jgi:hypothetical protein